MSEVVFISHASDDKHTVAMPLAVGLRAAGVSVWLDAEQLQLGDSLRSRIDRALSDCEFGVVVLSPAYLRKEWPARELDALLSLEEHHGKRILPVWHNIDGAALAERSPLMAARLAISTSAGIDHVVREIVRAGGWQEATTNASPSPTFDRPQSLIGLTISSYRLERFVGAGGSGLVFKASHPQQGSKLALKVFFPLRPAVSHLTHLFERGFHAVKAVNHPNVSSVVDYGTCVIDARSTAFLVTRFVDGIPLDKWRRTPDGRDFNKRLQVAYSLTDGLATCHATTFRDEVGIQVTGVHHGDIKPANILVDTRNTPVLIDFLQIDVQRLIDLQMGTAGRAGNVPLTHFYGTFGFMDKDQERYGLITTETDTYSLGVTLAHLFRSLDIDDDDHGSKSIWALLSDEALPGSLRTLIRQMISTDRPTLLEARAVLQSLLKESEPSSGWSRIRRFFSR